MVLVDRYLLRAVPDEGYLQDVTFGSLQAELAVDVGDRAGRCPFYEDVGPDDRFLLRIDDRPGNLFRLCQEQGDVLVGYTKRNISFAAEQVPQDLVQALIGLLDGDPFVLSISRCCKRICNLFLLLSL